MIKMKFTFKKYILKIIIGYLIAILFFFGIIYYNSLNNTMFAYDILLFMGGYFLVSMLFKIFLIIIFLKKHSKIEIKKFEKELSNFILKYSDCMLTETYIFLFKTLDYIKYDELICLDSSKIALIGGYHLTFGKKFCYI